VLAALVESTHRLVSMVETQCLQGKLLEVVVVDLSTTLLVPPEVDRAVVEVMA
jgi:hypothetical protein